MKATTRNAIIELKRAKEQSGISCQSIYDTCDKNGEAVGMSTIRRIFLPGSEDKANDFRPATLNAIFHALIGTDNCLSKAENDALTAVVEMNDRAIAEKDATIKALTRELEDTRLRLETVTEMFRIAMEAIGKSVVTK